MTSEEQDGDPDAALINTTLTLVENWFEELNRLVPVP